MSNRSRAHLLLVGILLATQLVNVTKYFSLWDNLASAVGLLIILADQAWVVFRGVERRMTTSACVYIVTAGCLLSLPGWDVGLWIFLMWRFLSSVLTYINGGWRSGPFTTRKLSLEDSRPSSKLTYKADVSKISDHLLVGCNSPPTKNTPAVDVLDFCNQRLLPGFWREFELPATGRNLMSIMEIAAISKDATKYMVAAPVNVAVIIGSSPESIEVLSLVSCCIMVIRGMAKDGRQAFTSYALKRYIEPVPLPDDILHPSSIRQLDLLSNTAQFLTTNEMKPPMQWAVASISVFNIPDWLGNVNVSIINLYGDKRLVIERQVLLRNEQRMKASFNWKDEETLIVSGEVYVVLERCVSFPADPQEPRLLGGYGCLLPDSTHLQKMLASNSGAHYLDLSVDQCDVYDPRLKATGMSLSVLLRPVEGPSAAGTVPFPPSPEEIGDFLDLPVTQPIS